MRFLAFYLTTVLCVLAVVAYTESDADPQRQNWECVPECPKELDI